MKLPRVLIVDDNAMNITLAQVVLSADGWDVESASDADEALRQISAFGPDLILMDIQLPGMDGLELAGRVKADPATQHIVIVAFTAYAMRGDEEKMRAAGCEGYVSKPINVNQFSAQIRSMLPTPDRDRTPSSAL